MHRHATVSLDKDILPGLSRRTALPWLKDAALDWAIILGALGVVHIVSSPVTWLLALLIIGNRQHALAILGHDGTHFTLSHDRRLNDFLTNLLAFWPLGLTVSGYRTLHFKHHKHTGTEDDPELGHKRSRNPQWDLPAKPSRILKYAVLDIVGGSFPDYLIILKYSKPDKLSEYVPLLCFHTVAITLFAASGLWGCGLLWYAGLATTFMMFFRLRLWLEHQGTDDTQRLCLTWWQASAAVAAQRLASLGAPQISDDPISQAAAGAATPHRSRHSDAARPYRCSRKHRSDPFRNSAQDRCGNSQPEGRRNGNRPCRLTSRMNAC